MNAPIITKMTSSGSSSASSSQQSPSHAVFQPDPVHLTDASTDPFLNNFNLLAEAAKRAQVAVMIRDFEDCSL